MRNLIDWAQVRGSAYADLPIVGRESQAIGVRNGLLGI
jgi:hypothetical protein